MVYRIAITGPESTGKSTLAQQLAAHFNTLWVPEYARFFIENIGCYRSYIASDLWHIARQQMAWEDNYAQQAAYAAPNSFLFCDTELLVLKIWHKVAYRYVPDWLQAQWEARCRHYALFLLLDADLPWQYDPQREHENLRYYLLQYYTRELEAMGLPFVTISGQGSQRIGAALNAIEQYVGGSIALD